ncbi:MAG: penicillin-insensitive murein endopeptidase [Candidatus Endobugula sp.]|jgi:penicillin-insensitive murein endopeptidase
MKLFFITILLFSHQALSEESICYGTTSNGKLEGGVQLPSSGNNFVGYSSVARIAGRTYVHSTVKDIIVSAYNDLYKEQPDKVYKYAETGRKEGGQFKPHKTHRNGLSVDFMTPVVNSRGESVHLPTHPLNKLGYNIEFDANDKYNDLSIDYEAMAAHIVFLHKQSVKRGHNLWRVIFDPTLQANLFNTKYARYLKTNIKFSKKRSWVRHDEHYHVDFSIPCKK